MRDLPPIPVHKTVSRQTVEEPMRSYVIMHDLLKSPTTLLCAAFEASQVSISTTYLRFLMKEFGCEVSNIEKLAQYPVQKPFKEFVQWATEEWKAADLEKNDIKSNLFKAFANRSFGFSLSKIQCYKRYRYGGPAMRHRYWLSDNFVGAEEAGPTGYGEEFFEIALKPKTLYFQLPTTIGFEILWFSKIMLMDFFHNFLLKYHGMENIDPLLTDTDSVYYATSQANLRDCVDFDRFPDYDEVAKRYLVDYSSPQAFQETKKTPGLWKIEQTGTVAVALSSKTYYVGKEGGIAAKVAHKGLQKKATNVELQTFNAYFSTLMNRAFIDDEDKPPRLRRWDEEVVEGGSDSDEEEDYCITYVPRLKYGENRGFRKVLSGIYTYKLHKRGLTAMYLKANLCNKGIFCYTDPAHKIVFKDDSYWPHTTQMDLERLP